MKAGQKALCATDDVGERLDHAGDRGKEDRKADRKAGILLWASTGDTVTDTFQF